MTDPVVALRDKEARLEARLKKARAAVERDESELEEVRTALRQLAKLGLISGEDDDDQGPFAGDINAAHSAILSCVPYGEEFAIAPKEVVAMLQAGGGFEQSADYVRTALWRMATKKRIIESKNGLYWRPAVELAEANVNRNVKAPDASTSEASNGSGLDTGRGTGFPSTPPGGSIPPSSTHPRPAPAWDADLDDDVPF